MKTTAVQRFGLGPLLVIAAVAAALVTLASTYGMIAVTPPCGGPWCLYGLVYLPVSGVAAAIVALVVARYARLGGMGYVAALIAGTVGYVVAWQILSNGMLLQF